MTAHTPGPWTIKEYADFDRPNLVIHRGDTENRICFMATPGSHGDPVMIEANARLIAAAPELLIALQRAATKLDAYVGVCNGDKELTGTIIPMARAAIAKATTVAVSIFSTAPKP